jgi:hypothetical protein
MGTEREEGHRQQRADQWQTFAAALWELRDDAYDHPDRWSGATAEALFQALATTIERLGDSDESLKPSEFVGLVRAEMVRSQDAN